MDEAQAGPALDGLEGIEGMDSGLVCPSDSRGLLFMIEGGTKYKNR